MKNNILSSIICWLGFHKWEIQDSPLHEMHKTRHCIKCNKKQETSYDMCYGGTYWHNI